MSLHVWDGYECKHLHTSTTTIRLQFATNFLHHQWDAAWGCPSHLSSLGRRSIVIGRSNRPFGTATSIFVQRAYAALTPPIAPPIVAAKAATSSLKASLHTRANPIGPRAQLTHVMCKCSTSY